MPERQLYKYRAINNKTGETLSGTMAAASDNELSTILSGNDLELIKAHPEKGGLGMITSAFQPAVKTRDRIQFYRVMEQLLRAGVPIVDSVQKVAENISHPKLKNTLITVANDISSGKSLSEAMEAYPTVFSRLSVAMVAAEEEGGKLGNAMANIAKHEEWMDDMNSRIKKALSYPLTVLFMFIVVLIAMLTYVVPAIADFLREQDMALPWYTEMLLASSSIAQDYWMVLPAVLIIGYVIIKVGREQSARFSYRFDGMLLKLPLVGPVVRKSNLARFVESLGVLYATGQPLIDGIDKAKGVVTNDVLNRSIDYAVADIKQGATLAEAFGKTGDFPSIIVEMLDVGQETGQLQELLDQAASFYNRDVNDAIHAMVGAIEPALMILMGGLIFLIVISVFGPVYSSFEKLM